MTPQNAPSLRRVIGGCLCGAVSFEVVNAFEKLFLCSCDQCRQITGSAFASNLFVGIEGFDWLGGVGDIVNYQVPERDISKSFCRVCGSGVPWANGNGTKMIVPAGSLNRPVSVAERVRIFASEQPAWASDLEQVAAHATFPEPLGSEPMGPNSLSTDNSTIIKLEKP
ncbi:GFA family protein [Pseudohalocynthiibacter sp. F2068]|jgi:hypothetical protein|uniref:GFA family protein n=1 Tax=Pseudohalocynthiibacter sp. F2068 TaxID=2926418 RepID=UPI001FF3A162|nr:GFA family protein [Pseudohalocynthiibacter sp. F2068]MCK0104117.1 GFA family protein [Pseudohalocynthiibacter sp. F2068]